MRFKKISLFLFILLLLLKAGVAQHYNLKKITKSEGLSGSSINYIIQDSKGYIWIASQEGGLCRYDGKKFKTFTKQDGLPTNDITAICEDDNNNIWIGTAKGVACYDGLKVKLIKNSGLDTSQINSIYKDKKNNIWFATQGNGWIKFDGKQYTQFTTLNGLPTNDIFCTLQDKEGNYWVGTYHFGVCKIQALSTQSSKLYCKIYKAEDGIGSNNIFSLLEDRKGNIWLGSTTHFISTISSKGEIKRIVVEKEYENDCVYKMVQDDKGAVWAATEDHGLFKINDYSISNYSEKEGFPSHQIYSLCIDNEANIWAGTLGKGVCVFKNEAFLNFNENDGLSNSQIVSIYQLNSRLILIGTNSGLCYYDEKKIISVNEISDLKNEAIRSISSDNDGNIWLGTDNGITIIRKKEKFEFVKHIDELDKTKISIVFSIIKSHTGVMWVATSGQGLFSINGKEIKNYKAPKDLPSDELFSLFEDDKNTIWIGLVKGGAAKFDGSKFTFFNKKNELSDNTIENINQDKKGNILFATAEGGLFCYDGKTFHNITVANGISSNIVNSTLSDPYNADIIWLGTANGLNRIKIDANFKVVSVKVYNDQNGLFGNEIGENSMLVDNQKNIWIGGPEGLSKFNTTLERVNSTPPVLVLSGIRLFYQTVDWSNYTDSVDLKTSLPVKLDLNYKNNHLTFDFQALSADNNIKYQFKLDGFDANWSPLSAANEAIYSNIPSGKKYTFRAKAMNGDGLWSNKDIEYRFIIESPWYLRWWFITLGIVAIIAGIFLYIRWRTSKLAEEKKLLEDTVEERTLELKDTNSQLSDAFKDIKDSINYAQKIQQSILPVESKIKAALPDFFILFKPRDIVSGDFYWFGSVNKEGVLHHVIAAADCTGHGVPGAFMSMVGNTILNEIVITKHITNPSEILSQLHHGVRTALQQSENESRDGMDISLCSINSQTNQVLYAGAFNPLWILRNNSEMEIIKATKSAIGGFTPDDQVFESHTVQLHKGESIYLFTDGYADQFGGELGKKLTAKKFRDAILSNRDKLMKDQGFYLANYIEIWKGKESQVDDILVIGIRIV